MQRKELLKEYKELLNKVNWLKGVIAKYGFSARDSNINSSLCSLSYDLNNTLNQEVNYYVLSRNENGEWKPISLSEHLISFSKKEFSVYTIDQINEYLTDYKTLEKAGIIKLKEVDE